MIGFLLAIISSLFYSVYIVPRKLSTLSPVAFSFFMAVSFFISSLALYLFHPFHISKELFSPVLFCSVVAGIIWAIAFVCFVNAIDLIGLAKSNQWKNLQGPINALLSILLLGEFSVINPFFTLIGAIAIFLSAICFTIPANQHKHTLQKGIIFACLSAVGFGSVATIQKYVTDHTGIYLQQIVWSFSIASSLGIYILFTKKLNEIMNKTKQDLTLGAFAGILYLGASLFQLLSYKYLPASIAFTIVQLNAFWTVLIGIFIFKEINFKKNYKRISVGLFFIVVGILLLTFSRL